MTTVALDILAELDRLGVTVEARGDRLLLDAPHGAMTPDLVQRVREGKPAILEALAAPPIVHDAVDALPEAEVETGSTTTGPQPDGVIGSGKSAGTGSTTGPQPDGSYHAANPARQRVVDLLWPIEQHDPDMARAMADAWMERVAICTIDGGLSPEDAEAEAYRELVGVIAMLPTIPAAREDAA